MSSGRRITDLERLTRPGGKVLPDDETIPVLTERLVLPSLELDTSLPTLATADTVAPVVPAPDATGADTATTGATAPDDEVANTAFPLPAPDAVDIEAMLPPSGTPFVSAGPPTPVAREATLEAEAMVTPVGSRDPEMAIEAEAIVEPEPIIEREAIVAPDLIIEPDLRVEPEPIIEREPIVEPEPIAEPEAVFEPEAMATSTAAPETPVATGMTLAPEVSIDWAEVEESARDALLRELQLRLASELDRQLRERLQPTLVRMLLATVTELRPSIEAAVREAVTRAVAAEIARQRSGD